MRYKSPCLDCPERQLGCHATCEKYIKFQTQSKQEKARIFEERRADSEYRKSRRLSKMRAVGAKRSGDYYRFRKSR